MVSVLILIEKYHVLFKRQIGILIRCVLNKMFLELEFIGLLPHERNVFRNNGEYIEY